MRSSHAGRGCPWGGVAIYTWRPVRWGASISHWHSSAASRWRRVSRLRSATASHSTRSPLRLSSSWRSAAAGSVGSMRSKGSRVSSSRDRASSYTGLPVLKCATASRAAPFSGGCHRMVAALCPHVCISVPRAPWRREGRCGGGGGRSDEQGHISSPSCLRPWGRLQPFLRRGVPRVVRARPADHGGPRPGVRPPPLEQDGGVLLRRGLWGARGGAPSAPLARPLLTHYACLPRGHGAAPDDPRWEEGALQVPRETPRQVPVRVGVLLWRAFQSAIHDTEGGYKVPGRPRGKGGGSCPPPP